MDENAETPRKMGVTMFILAWLVFFGLVAASFDDWLEKQANPNQLPQSRDRNGVVEVILQANKQHHYVVNGSINGQEVVFLLDTGATDVVVPLGLSRRLGLVLGPKQLAVTANGTVAVFNTRLATMKIGAIELRNIRASINPGMDGKVVLLGMSALRQIEFSQRGDTLILRQ